MRFSRHLSGLAGLLALAALVGCGSQGNPLPPSLELPKPVSDLKAARKGDKVLLTWTAPRETTDKLRIKEAGKTRVCRSTAEQAAMKCEQIGEVPGPAAPVAETFIDYLANDLLEPTRFAVYTVEAMNTRGRSAGRSNAVKVPLAATLPPPDKLFSQVTAEGPVISWVVPADEHGQSLLLPEAAKAKQPVAYSYRLYRRERSQITAAVVVPLEKASISPTVTPPNLSVRDTGTEWGKVYVYWVTVVSRVTADGQTAEVEGEDSPPVEVFVHDVFPPATPTEVQAVASSSGGGQSFIDLTWTPNSEADLAGYNVYRRQAAGQPQKINAEPAKTPAFRDSSVSPGETYLYSVSAVDLRSNESGRSEETSESVPQP